MSFRDQFRKRKYWDNAKSIYGSLGGKYKKASSSGMIAPEDENRWIIARELAATNKRVCVECGYSEEVKKVSDVKKHCGKLMAADLTAQDRNDIKKYFGKIRVKLNQSQKKQVEEHMKKECDEESPEDDKEEKESSMLKYTANFIRDDEDIGNCHWVVKHGENPVLKLTLSQAYPGKENTKAAPFSNRKYGQMLVESIEENGLDKAFERHLHKRGTLITAQVNPMAPDIFQAETGVEDNDMQGRAPQGPQADRGLVNKDIGDDILEDKTDESNIIELVKEALVPVIVASSDEITPEAVVEELKNLFQSEQALSKFQGSLAEKVEDSKANEVMEEDKEQEAMPAAPMDSANVGAAPAPPTDQQPMLAASKKRIAKLNGAIKEAESKIESLNKELSKYGETNKELVGQLRQERKRVSELEEEKQELLGQNKKLIADRTIRIRYPRCASLAREMVDIGEIESKDVQSTVNSLLKSPTKEFMALESRVKKVHAKLNIHSVDSDNVFTEKKGLLGIVPEQRDEDKKEATLVSGPRNGASSSIAQNISWS